MALPHEWYNMNKNRRFQIYHTGGGKKYTVNGLNKDKPYKKICDNNHLTTIYFLTS